MWVRVAVGIALLLSPTALHAQAEKRIALLIGNRTYDASVGVLRNPHNDVAVVGEALAKQGFEVLPPIKDGKRSAILGGVRELTRKLKAAGPGAIGFLYYSGHGAAEKDTNINYLIPVDAKEPGTSTFWDESVKLDDVLRLLDGARASAKFIVFDACRNELQLPTKDTTKGLVPVTEQQGMFIAFASAPGRTASDRGDKSGPYAEALANELGKPGVDHLNLFQNVKEAVLATTGGTQQPWESNGLGRRVYLTGPPARGAAPAPPPSLQPLRLSEAAEAWGAAKEVTDVAVLDAFVARYKDTFYAELARSRIEELNRQHAAVATSSAPIRGRSCADTYKNFWNSFGKARTSRMGAEQFADLSRTALSGYDACNGGDERFYNSGSDFFTRLAQLGPNVKASDIFKTPTLTLPTTPSYFTTSASACGKAYKDFWDGLEHTKLTTMSPEQFADLSRTALRGYDACNVGDDRFTADGFFARLGRLGANEKASDIFKSGAFAAPGAKRR